MRERALLGARAAGVRSRGSADSGAARQGVRSREQERLQRHAGDWRVAGRPRPPGGDCRYRRHRQFAAPVLGLRGRPVAPIGARGLARPRCRCRRRRGPPVAGGGGVAARELAAPGLPGVPVDEAIGRECCHRTGAPALESGPQEGGGPPASLRPQDRAFRAYREGRGPRGRDTQGRRGPPHRRGRGLRAERRTPKTDATATSPRALVERARQTHRLCAAPSRAWRSARAASRNGTSGNASRPRV